MSMLGIWPITMAVGLAFILLALALVLPDRVEEQPSQATSQREAMKQMHVGGRHT